MNKEKTWKPGEKVRISENPSDPNRPPLWNLEMDKYKGMVVTLKEKIKHRSRAWHIEEDAWVFSERWFEPVN